MSTVLHMGKQKKNYWKTSECKTVCDINETWWSETICESLTFTKHDEDKPSVKQCNLQNMMKGNYL